MGCGKSSVGRRLSELLCCRFADLDAVIEEQEVCSIAEIFDRGEAEFRRIEKETLKGIIDKTESSDVHEASKAGRMVLALGGGAVMTPSSAEMVHEKTVCIYLRASVHTLLEHLDGEAAKRPLLTTGNHSSQADSTALRHRIESLMALRSTTYEHVAHHIIDTDGKCVEEIAREILDLGEIKGVLQHIPGI